MSKFRDKLKKEHKEALDKHFAKKKKGKYDDLKSKMLEDFGDELGYKKIPNKKIDALG